MNKWITDKQTYPREYQRVFISVNGKVSTAYFEKSLFFDDCFNVWDCFDINQIDAWKEVNLKEWVPCNKRLPIGGKYTRYVFVHTNVHYLNVAPLKLYKEPGHEPIFVDNDGCFVCKADENAFWQNIRWPEAYKIQRR